MEEDTTPASIPVGVVAEAEASLAGASTLDLTLVGVAEAAVASQISQVEAGDLIQASIPDGVGAVVEVGVAVT